MGWIFTPLTIPMVAVSTMKKIRQTGAKKVMRATRGPGLIFSGTTTPMSPSVRRSSARQTTVVPPSAGSTDMGERLVTG